MGSGCAATGVGFVVMLDNINALSSRRARKRTRVFFSACVGPRDLLLLVFKFHDNVGITLLV